MSEMNMNRALLKKLIGFSKTGTSVSTVGIGSVPAAVAPYVVATEYGNGVTRQTLLTLTNLPQAILDATSFLGTKIYDFPEGRVQIQGCIAKLAPKTTTAIATTIKSAVAGSVALGTVAASAIALTGTMVDLAPATPTVNSTVINVAAATVNAVLAASAIFAGQTTAIDMYLNSSVAAADIDGNGTLHWNGTILCTWVNLGDY